MVAVLVLAMLSGCSVLLDDGDSAPVGDVSTPAPTGDDGSTPVPAGEATSTPTTGGSSTPADSDDSTPTRTPASSASLSTFDAAALNDGHVTALQNAGSFTAESSLIIRSEDSVRYINGSYAIERGGPAANTANITFVGPNGTRDFPTSTRYTESDTTYERQVARTDNGTEVGYRSASAPYNDSGLQPVNRSVAYSLGEIAREVIDNSTWNETGSGTFDGERVTRYDTSGERFGAGQLGPNAEGAATMAVDENGAVRYVAYQFVTTVSGERTTYSYEATYVDVGGTNVRRPDWTDEA
ncbi:hypothetical protein HWV23_07070 [Natronomonas halophila]|uniref:DUF7537 family lipoprotein n=1 Tax=Natronomonas halophila TaxID=2747817 RepID=UPI0015B4E870|nr:hypothetical protein [Natronomonas halophila]QLD85495.1 hypothetical protein HWV23_07070 [Natronomonas halophila]